MARRHPLTAIHNRPIRYGEPTVTSQIGIPFVSSFCGWDGGSPSVQGSDSWDGGTPSTVGSDTIDFGVPC